MLLCVEFIVSQVVARRRPTIFLEIKLTTTKAAVNTLGHQGHKSFSVRVEFAPLLGLHTVECVSSWLTPLLRCSSYCVC